MSDFACPVVRIGKVEKHPNADTLSITEVDGCPVIFKTGDFREGDFGVYVPIESVVKQDSPGGKAMTWLQWKYNGTARIKAAKLRGIFSMGVLIPIPSNLDHNFNEESPSSVPQPLPEGANLAPALGIEKYVEPEATNTRGEDAQSPQGFQIPVYDLESFRKYKGLFKPGEYVAITEKIHGCNGRFAFLNGALQVGSHNRWKRRPTEGQDPAKSDVWWRLALHPVGEPVRFTKDSLPALTLEQKLQHPDVAEKLCFYGEVYGQVQDLKYGIAVGVRVAMFDVLDLKTQKWLDYPEFLAVCGALGLETVPCLFTGQLTEEKVFELAEGLTEVGDGGANIREGIVIRPLRERQDPHQGRICFKLHGQGYLLRKGGTERH